MNFFKQLFRRERPTVQCPRCLGKGHVDANDIKRLGNELKWLPGKCAYCGGAGAVKSDILSKVAANTSYLTLNRSKAERKRIIDGDPAALERMHIFDENVDRLNEKIKELHFNKRLTAEQIAELYLSSSSKSVTQGDRKKKIELIAYINFIIAHTT